MATFECKEEAQVGMTLEAYIYAELDYYGMELDSDP